MNPFNKVREFLNGLLPPTTPPNWFDEKKVSFDSSGKEKSEYRPGKISAFFSNLSSPSPQPPKQTGPGFDGPMLQEGSPGNPWKPQATPQQVTPGGYQISVPSQDGSTFNFPPEIAQKIGNVFEPVKQATAAAQVLHHPMQQTRTPEEIKRLGTNFNRGENPELKVSDIDIPNDDGSVDRGLFRINSNTFSGMQKDPFWRQAMERRGIKSWDDMENADKNIEMAYLILARGNWDSQNSTIKENPKWNQWYAAPLELR